MEQSLWAAGTCPLCLALSAAGKLDWSMAALSRGLLSCIDPQHGRPAKRSCLCTLPSAAAAALAHAHGPHE